MQRFSTSDNHEELGANLKTLKDLGLNPYLCFSDNPNHDKSLLKFFYTNLNNGNKYEIEREEVPLELVELTTEKRILYCHTLDKVLRTISIFREDIEVHINDVSNGDDAKICVGTGMLDLLSTIIHYLWLLIFIIITILFEASATILIFPLVIQLF